jgi:hypothetical protein
VFKIANCQRRLLPNWILFVNRRTSKCILRCSKSVCYKNNIIIGYIGNTSFFPFSFFPLYAIEHMFFFSIVRQILYIFFLFIMDVVFFFFSPLSLVYMCGHTIFKGDRLFEAPPLQHIFFFLCLFLFLL